MATVRFVRPNTVIVSEGQPFLEFEVVLSEPVTVPVTVTIRGGFGGNADIDQSVRTVTFAAGQTTASFRTAIVQDALYEGDESFEFNIESATGGVQVGGETGPTDVNFTTRLSVRLVDDDAPPAGPFTGDDGANTITGGAGADLVAGYGGDDVLAGGGGNDTLDGSAGADRLTGGDGIDIVRGGAGDDVIVATPGFVQTFGTSEIFDGGTGVDTVDLSAATGGVVVAAADVRSGSAGNGGGLNFFGLFLVENLIGSAFDDTLGGSADANVLRGEGGDDRLSGGVGDDVLNGGAGVDLADFSQERAGVTVNLRTGVATGEGSGRDTLISIENLTLSFFDDVAQGDDNANRIDGAESYNVLNGGGGDDILISGFDGVLSGEDGNDRLQTLIGDLFGGAGNDVLFIQGSDANILDGGAGRDLLSLSVVSQETVTVDLALSGSQPFGTDVFGPPGTPPTLFTATITGIEDVNGSVFAANTLLGNADGNALTGGSQADRLEGRGGDDGLLGEFGDDTLIGGDGDDVVNGGQGVDRLDGGAGLDRASFFSAQATQAVVVDLRAQTVTNDGFGNAETLVSIESLGGGTRFADTFRGDEGANVILAEGGDLVEAFGGDDTFRLGARTFRLDGGLGSDSIELFTRTRLSQRLDINGSAITETTGRGVIVDLLTQQILDDGFTDSGANKGLLGFRDFFSIENVGGSAGADALRGDDAANRLNGREGDDVLEGRGGDDVLTGGAGADVFTIGAASGADVITDFEIARDSVRLSAGVSIREVRQDGADTLIVTTAAQNSIRLLNIDARSLTTPNLVVGQVLDAGAFAVGTSAGDLISAERNAGDTLLYGQEGDDRVRGGSGADVVWAGAGDDRVDGLAGADTLIGEGGLDQLYGGDGDDKLYGGDGQDLLAGEAGADQLFGGLGSDLLFGGAGADLVVGEAGRDELWGGTEDDRVFGGEGDDVLVGEAGADELWGGTDADALYGADGDDLMVGEDGADQLFGGLGADRMYGSAGADLMAGEAGDDVLWGGFDNDRLFGGEGADLQVGEFGDDELWGGLGNDLLYGGQGRDLIVGEEGDDQLYGGFDDDRIYGGAGVDLLVGEDGADILFGGVGNDTLQGGNGADLLVGEDGDDVLIGGGSGDQLSGGAGADRFVFSSALDGGPFPPFDRIGDFRPGEGDVIDLSRIDANPATAADDAFVFASAFTGVAGQAVLRTAGNVTTLLLDLNGDRNADLQIQIDGVFTVDSPGFLL